MMTEYAYDHDMAFRKTLRADILGPYRIYLRVPKLIAVKQEPDDT